MGDELATWQGRTICQFTGGSNQQGQYRLTTGPFVELKVDHIYPYRQYILVKVQAKIVYIRLHTILIDQSILSVFIPHKICSVPSADVGRGQLQFGEKHFSTSIY